MADPHRESVTYSLVGSGQDAGAGAGAGPGGAGHQSPAVRSRGSSNALADEAGGKMGIGAGAEAGRRGYLRTFTLIAAWYSSNLGVIMLNKALLSSFGYKFPIFLTFLHLVSCTLFSLLTAKLGLVERQEVKSRAQHLKIGVLAMLLCLSFVGGNISLRYIPVSFNQAIGATTPFFTAIAAYLIQRKVESTATYMSLVPVVVGIVIASNSEPSFHLFGFAICITSPAFRAIKVRARPGAPRRAARAARGSPVRV